VKPAPATIELESPGAEAIVAWQSALGDPALRTALFGGRGRIDVESALARWTSPPEPGNTRLALRCIASATIVGGIGVVAEELSFFVDPAWQGRGHGRAALEALLRWRNERNLWPRLRARTVRENIAARRALQGAGFREHGIEHRAHGLPVLVHYRCAPG
jgi:RimJ/RimL family protein N-acetyltransferase